MHLEAFLRNSTETDDASARFRAHAQQTLDRLKGIPPAEQAGDGLGDSTATPPVKRGRANAKDGAEHDGALPPLVDA